MKNTRDIRKFMFAGKAFFKIINKRTGKEYVYKVFRIPKEKRLNPEKEMWFVSLYNDIYDIDNWRAYDNIGSLQKTNILLFKYSSKSKIQIDNYAIKLFCFFLDRLCDTGLPDWIDFYHIDKCGRCSRELKTDEGMESGFGDDCIKLIN